ncbi:phosphotransferase [Micromonospora sp. NBRC 101691]|uniref:phosphotransferase n=1 Tax=Micromonospora sp. NBRC 101691 TaxID=3032198 RepID=UPI0024A49BB0|nr:phosphotransferase [Micromonospora sp. NBRC 101691]GLY24098.1 hypothetical protein Misp04_38300 [Micromonospora sp. NBRC 101691]
MEERLSGGNTGGAVRIGDTVRRTAGPWTPAVHALLQHLEAVGFAGAPRARGVDEQGREVLTYLPGEVVGDRRPWPSWVHGADALRQVAGWLRDFHTAVAGFVPPPDAVWREGARWRPGLIVGHNDAAPYNAAWSGGRLVGFFDWDFAAPVPVGWDVAFTAFAWVPLHARHVAAAEGFTAFADRRPGCGSSSTRTAGTARWRGSWRWSGTGSPPRRTGSGATRQPATPPSRSWSRRAPTRGWTRRSANWPTSR